MPQNSIGQAFTHKCPKGLDIYDLQYVYIRMASP